jgi:hypothetical protein
MLGVFLCLWLAQSQTPSSSIEGTVIDGATAKGLTGARVRLQCGQDDPSFTTVGDSGRFQFPGLRGNGECLLRAEYPGYMSERAGPQGIGNDLPAPFYSLATLTLRRYGIVAGRVLDADGFPAPGARVEVYLRVARGARLPSGLRGTPLEQGDSQYWLLFNGPSTDDRGEYRIVPLAAGTYYLCAYGQDSPALRGDTRYRPTFYPHSIALPGAAPVKVAEGEVSQGIDIQLARAAGVAVSGRLLGLPPPGADRPPSTGVQMWREEESAPRAVASAGITGDRFEIKDLLPGRYVLAATSGKTTMFSGARGEYVAAFGAKQVVEVGDRDIGGLEVAMQPARDIAVAVTFENGCTYVPLTVFLQGPVMPAIRATTESDGTYVLRHVPPGVYRLYLISEDNRRYPGSVFLGGREIDMADAFDVTSKTPERIGGRACGRPSQ